MQRTEASRHHIERARAFGNVGRWTAAKRELLAALAEEPDDIEAMARLEMARVQTGEIPVAEAEARLRALADERPDLVLPRLSAAAMVGRYDPAAALQELRRLASEFPDDGSIPALICAFAQKDHPGEAWAAFQRAVELGGRTTRTTRLIAYRCSRQLGQGEVGRRLVLKPAPPLERAALRTFTRQAPQFFLWASLAAWAGVGILFGRGQVWSGVLLSLLAVILPAWVVFSSLYICRARLCVKNQLRAAPLFFVFLPAVAWMAYLLETPHYGWTLIVVIVWGALCGGYSTLVCRTKAPAAVTAPAADVPPRP